MGMFDTIRCSYDLGPGYLNRELQTKDLDCCMTEYWLDPAGRLYEIDYTGTHDFYEVPEEERSAPWNFFEQIPNGNHGKIKPVYLFKVIEVYPAKWDAYYSKWPSCFILFRDGIVQEVRHTNLHEENEST
jgi:hypothetical protein